MYMFFKSNLHFREGTLISRRRAKRLVAATHQVLSKRVETYRATQYDLICFDPFCFDEDERRRV